MNQNNLCIRCSAQIKPQIQITCQSDIYCPNCSTSTQDLEFLYDNPEQLYFGSLDEITDRVYLGNEIDSNEKKRLQIYGITHILVCGANLKQYYPNDFIYKQILIEDRDDEDIAKYFEATYEFIEQAVVNTINEQNKGGDRGALKEGKVFVHCSRGVSRSAAIVIAYIMKKENMNYKEAFEFVKDKRNMIRPNRGFVKQLKDYLKK